MTLSERAARLTRELLTYARKPDLARRPTVIADLVSSTADLLRRSLYLEVALDLPEQVVAESLLVSADVNQFQHALVNLTLNARDACAPRERVSPEAIIQFRLRHHPLDAELRGFPQNVPAGDYVLIEVSDRGSGMSPEVLNQAIDPFFTTKEVGQGTGLGLPVVFGIIQGHQGYLTITSQPAQGTCVGIYLPRLARDGSATDPGSSFEIGQVIEPETTPGKRILVVDDEPVVLNAIREFLESAGHHVHATTSGQEAINHLVSGNPTDLVILDLMMPRAEGVRLFHRLREVRANLPVLVCNGLPDVDDSAQASAGSSGCHS